MISNHKQDSCLDIGEGSLQEKKEGKMIIWTSDSQTVLALKASEERVSIPQPRLMWILSIQQQLQKLSDSAETEITCNTPKP